MVCLQFLLEERSEVLFTENFALDKGGAMYVEDVSYDFIQILNRGCFLQYLSDNEDLPPNDWVNVAPKPRN